MLSVLAKELLVGAAIVFVFVFDDDDEFVLQSLLMISPFFNGNVCVAVLQLLLLLLLASSISPECSPFLKV